MDFSKYNLVNNILSVVIEDGSILYISESGATESELEIINLFRKTFPKGKEWYKIVDSVVTELTQAEYDILYPATVVVPTEIEEMQAQLTATQTVLNFILMN